MRWRLMWHFFRLALAAVLLWWDTRIFLFYAFTMLVAVLDELEILRAYIKVHTIQDGIRHRVILSKVGATEEDCNYVAIQLREEMDDPSLKALDKAARRIDCKDGFPWEEGGWLNYGARSGAG